MSLTAYQSFVKRVKRKNPRMSFKQIAKKWSNRRSKRKSRRTVKIVKIRRRTKMARRRKRSVRRRLQTLSPNDAALFGFGYGLVREPVNSGLKKLTGNFALNLSDELVLGGLAYLGAKKNVFGMRKAFTVVTAVEAHNLGRNVVRGGLQLYGRSQQEAL